MARYALVNGVILDGTAGMQPKEGLAVVVNEKDIEAICPAESLGEGVLKVDLKGAYILPGLINMHVHLPVAGNPPKDAKPVDYKGLMDKLGKYRLAKWYFKKSAAKFARTQLRSGVTTVRAVGGLFDLDARVRDDINAGLEEGPRLIVANTAVSVPGGHFAGSLATEATTSEEAAAQVREIAATGVDLIKLMITGGVMDATEEGEPGALRMPPEMVKAACDAAHELGLCVAAHVESTEGVRVALENGVDTIEHGANPTPEVLELFKSTGAAHIATLSPAIPYALFPLEVSKCGETGQKNGRIVFEGIKDCAKACLEAGIPVGLGTDTGCPFITHYNMWREVRYFAHFCNVSNAFALHTATLRNAQILGIADETGSVEVGKRADLIVCEGNPLENLSALRNLRLVIARGRIINRLKFKRIPGVDEHLDAVERDLGM